MKMESSKAFMTLVFSWVISVNVLQGRVIEQRDLLSTPGLISTNDVDRVSELSRNLVMLQQRLESRIRDLENKTNQIASIIMTPQVVGFTVQLDNSLSDIPAGTKVVFDGVWFNVGNGYDRTTGIFTCPQTGLYLFALFVEGAGTQEAVLNLIIDGRHRISAVAEKYQAEHVSTGGNILVEYLQQGQRVWIQTADFDKESLFRAFTTFSGVLIQPEK